MQIVTKEGDNNGEKDIARIRTKKEKICKDSPTPLLKEKNKRDVLNKAIACILGNDDIDLYCIVQEQHSTSRSYEFDKSAMAFVERTLDNAGSSGPPCGITLALHGRRDLVRTARKGLKAFFDSETGKTLIGKNGKGSFGMSKCQLFCSRFCCSGDDDAS